MAEPGEVRGLLPDGRRRVVTADGTVVLVPDRVAVGDHVEVRLVERRGRSLAGEVVRVVQDSPDRRVPPCPFTADCGGCDLDMMTEASQRDARHAFVAARLARLGDVTPLHHPVAPFSAYRARIKLHLEHGRVGYRAASSHDLVPVDVCRIARPELQRAHAELLRWLHADPERTSGLPGVELRSDGHRAVYAFHSEGSVPRATRDALPQLGDVALDGRALSGDPTLTLHVHDVALRASPRAFYQVHLEANLVLVNLVVQAVQACGPQRIVDLYAGIGNLTLPLARRTGVPVVAVEREGQATADLAFNAEQAGVASRVHIVTRPVERWDPSQEPFDVVVLDPPRVGAKGVVNRLLLQRPRRIVYVACHLPSALRDLQPAWKQGYRLTDASTVDLFPDTHHVETVLIVDRRDQ